MNKKFVKENKGLVKEFLGNLLTKIITGKVNKKFDKMIANDPKIQQHKKNIKKIEKQMLDKVKDAYNTNPEFKRVIDKYNIQVN